MRKKKRVKATIKQLTVWIIALLTYFAACDRDNALIDFKQIPIQFVAYVDESKPDEYDNHWNMGDEMGLFAVKSNHDLMDDAIVDNNNNVPYETSINGRFFPTDNKNLYYPKDGSSIDIIAYYPYINEATDYIYPIDIEKQHNVLYSNNIKKISKTSNPENTLHFKSVLSKLIINISYKDSEQSIDGITASIGGAKTKGFLLLTSGDLQIDNNSTKDIDVDLTGNKVKKQITAYLLPTKSKDKITVNILFPNGESYTWIVPQLLDMGGVYNYSIEIDDMGIEVVQSGYMELPKYKDGVKAPNSIQALHMVKSKDWLNTDYKYSNDPIRNFTVLYDSKNRIPYWIAYPMHPMYFGNANRTDEWAFDPIISDDLQPSLFRSWTGKALDRGHMLASADRNSTRDINRTTFYFTNMVPQNNIMNGGKWASLEGKVRRWANQSAYDTLYVVTGALLPKSPKPITYTTDNNGIESAVPEYLYKALLKKHKATNKYTSIAFKMTNDDKSIESVISISELEEETGFAFFNYLLESEAKSIKQNASVSPHWK